jgi:thiol:disulfide interchange protein DsbD
MPRIALATAAAFARLAPLAVSALGPGLAGCAAEPPPAPVALPAVAAAPAPAPAPASRIDEATYCRILDKTADAIGADLAAAASRTDLSAEQARRVLAHTTPVGARPHVEALLSAEGVSGEEVAAFVSAHADAAERCAGKFEARMQTFRASFDHVTEIARAETAPKEPFPWREDVEAARTEARKAQRPLVIVFCASWTMACSELDHRTFTDDAVRAALTQRFVAARQDMTDDDDASTKRAQARYKIEGLPVILVFDGKGRETARLTEWVDAAKLRSVLDGIH